MIKSIVIIINYFIVFSIKFVKNQACNEDQCSFEISWEARE